MFFKNPNALISLAAASLLTSVRGAATPVTVYSVVTFPTAPAISTLVHGTTTIRPVATLNNGSITQYEEVVVQSLLVDNFPPGETNAPNTFLTQPITFTSTFEQGSATLRFHQPAETETLSPDFQYINEDRTRNCSLDISKLSGACEEVVEFVGISAGVLSTSTFTTSYTASLMPIATITSGGVMSRMLFNGLSLSVGLLVTSLLTFGL